MKKRRNSSSFLFWNDRSRFTWLTWDWIRIYFFFIVFFHANWNEESEREREREENFFFNLKFLTIGRRRTRRLKKLCWAHDKLLKKRFFFWLFIWRSAHWHHQGSNLCIIATAGGNWIHSRTYETCEFITWTKTTKNLKIWRWKRWSMDRQMVKRTKTKRKNNIFSLLW